MWCLRGKRRHSAGYPESVPPSPGGRDARPTAAETAALPVLLTLFPRVSSKDSVPPRVRSVKQNYLADDGRSGCLAVFSQGYPSLHRRKIEEDSRVQATCSRHV